MKMIFINYLSLSYVITNNISFGQFLNDKFKIISSFRKIDHAYLNKIIDIKLKALI